MTKVILVDEQDNEIGRMEKLEAHQKGMLHRAFSVLIMNSNGEMLIQKRASGKYHSGGLWSNACCSHPVGKSPIDQEARERLINEMGIDTPLSFQYDFIYKVDLENNLIEHELDYVFLGYFDAAPKINKEEVEDWKYISIQKLQDDVHANPEKYSYWFRLILNRWPNEILEKK
jgi:isopentenyl-diphosphate delta-isomerase